MVLEESNMQFEFPDSLTAVKFDEESFYRNSFNKFPESKGVDFITDGNEFIAFIEVKNCRGHEGDNRWRIAPNNLKRDTVHVSHDVKQRDSLDIEVAQKVAMTLAALCGAYSFGDRKDSLGKLGKIAASISEDKFAKTEKKKLIILVLEGDFGTHTRPKTVIMSELQRNIMSKLQWLDCRVSVVDSDTYWEKVFRIDD